MVSPRSQSGCPDLNWGPLRPERSALPGCATPREQHRAALRRLRRFDAKTTQTRDTLAATVGVMNSVRLEGTLATTVEVRVYDERRRVSFLLHVGRPEHRGADFLPVVAWIRGRRVRPADEGRSRDARGRASLPPLGGRRGTAAAGRRGRGHARPIRAGEQGGVDGSKSPPWPPRRHRRLRERAARGRQVAGVRNAGPPGGRRAEVSKIVCGVSCLAGALRARRSEGAQLVLVHHGLFWRNEPLVVDRRLRGRLEALFRADLSLVAYHLALDAHPELGNNAQLAGRLGVESETAFAGVGIGGRLREPCTVEGSPQWSPQSSSGSRSSARRARACRAGRRRDRRRRVRLIRAAHEGYDVLVTGEPEEPSLHAARELGIHLVAAGHYATERLGVQALGEHLSASFGLTGVSRGAEPRLRATPASASPQTPRHNPRDR